jgi:MSHA biogenesis protein MshN
MSLINQVLQDLDRRHVGRAALPSAALPVAAPVHADGVRVRPSLLAIVAALLAAAAAAVLAWRQVDAQPTSAPHIAPALASSVTPPADLPIDGDTTVIHFPAAVPQAEVARDEHAPIAPAANARPFHDDESREPGATAAAASGPAALAAPPRSQASIASTDAASPLTHPAQAAPVRLEKSSAPVSAADRAEAEYLRGIDLHENARDGDAEAAFAATLQLDGGHAPARHALAVEWIGSGRTLEAERLLLEGLARDPRQPQLAVVLARIQAARQDSPAAIETLRASLGGSAVAPAHADARALLATLQQGEGQHRDAAESFAAALRQMPQNGPWWVGLGLSLAADGRTDSAREAFQRARATGSLSPELLSYVEQKLGTARP